MYTISESSFNCFMIPSLEMSSQSIVLFGCCYCRSGVREEKREESWAAQPLFSAGRTGLLAFHNLCYCKLWINGDEKVKKHPIYHLQRTQVRCIYSMLKARVRKPKLLSHMNCASSVNQLKAAEKLSPLLIDCMSRKE